MTIRILTFAITLLVSISCFGQVAGSGGGYFAEFLQKENHALKEGNLLKTKLDDLEKEHNAEAIAELKLGIYALQEEARFWNNLYSKYNYINKSVYTENVHAAKQAKKLKYLDANMALFTDYLPDFSPVPPPKASSSLMLVNKQTKKEIHDVLLEGLHEQGYYTRFYYKLKDGYVLLTDLENIDNTAKALQKNRWGELKGLAYHFAALDGFSFKDYLKGLFIPKKNKSRVFMFWVSSSSFSLNADIALKPQALATGVHPIDYEALLNAHSNIPNYSCTVLVYEFEKGEYETEDKLVLRSSIPAMEHLEKSGLMTVFKKHGW